MNLNSIISDILYRYPLFGNVIVNLDFQYTNKNVSAPAFTDGKTIYYKDSFINDYDENEKEFIIAHEIFHIILCHFFRNTGKDSDLLNYVEDAIINQLLLKDGLKMPEGVVNVENALEYSVEELYMIFLPRINEIKKWMGTNTYHIDLSQMAELMEKIMQDNYFRDLQELMANNYNMRNELLNDFSIALQFNSNNHNINKNSAGIEFPSVALGKETPILSWEQILMNNLNVLDDDSTSFYEVQMDGIIKKEPRNEDREATSEIIVDSSSSMDMTKIKIILRECKNILAYSNINVGFCDEQFYGWNNIRTEDDIDKLHIIGRGGTNFFAMADSFSNDADNKIVITDGLATFPNNRPDILWIIVARTLPPLLNPSYKTLYKNIDINNINYIFVDEETLIKKLNSESPKLLLIKQ